MKHTERRIRAISPVLAVLMMIAVAIAGSLVAYAWIMGYIGSSTEKAGQAILIQNIAHHQTGLSVYVQNVGEGVVQLEKDRCLYVDGLLADCTITGVTVSDDVGTLNQGETATLLCTSAAVPTGEKVKVKVVTSIGAFSEMYAYPAGTPQTSRITILWNRTYGGNGWAYSVVETSDGGYALVGSRNAWSLVKTDASGNMKWNKTYAISGRGGARSLVETSDVGYIMAGYSGPWHYPGSRELDYDYWLLKTDEFGNMEWNKTYGGPYDDVANSLVETLDGGYALAGYTNSSGAGNEDFWLVKTDAGGNMEWNRTYGGLGHDSADSLVVTLDGGYALAGCTNSSGAGSNDFWLVKTDELGNMEWARTYGGMENDEAHSLVATSDGGYAMAGTTESFGAGNRDFWLVKTDSSGNMEWNQTYGGTRDDYAWSLVENSDGGFALAGSTFSFGAQLCDVWLVKTDGVGDIEWGQVYGGAEHDLARSLAITSDGGYVIAGMTESFGAGDSVIWLIKTD